jgi:hypothetical protein
MMNLKSLLTVAMGDLIDAYGLSVVELSDSEILLRARTFAIDVSIDREGVSAVYFDTRSRPAKGYNILLFLLNKRRDRLTFHENAPEPAEYSKFIEGQLKGVIQHIRSAGLDILAGADDWMKSYSWPTVRLHDGIAALV